MDMVIIFKIKANQMLILVLKTALYIFITTSKKHTYYCSWLPIYEMSLSFIKFISVLNLSAYEIIVVYRTMLSKVE